MFSGGRFVHGTAFGRRNHSRIHGRTHQDFRKSRKATHEIRLQGKIELIAYLQNFKSRSNQTLFVFIMINFRFCSKSVSCLENTQH